MTFPWTDEHLATLTRLRAEGRTASQIAQEIGGGVTRNAVIGKWHRLGLPPAAVERPARKAPEPPKPEAPPRSAEPAESAMPVCDPTRIAPAPIARPEPAPPIGAGPAHAALKPHDCRWPIGDPAGEAFRFCAKPCMRPLDMPRARNGQLRVPIYCAAHYELSVQPGSERRTTRIMATAA